MFIIKRYILSEYLSPLGLGVLVFTFTLILDKIFTLVDLILVKGVASVLVFKLVGYLVPTFLPLVLPMSILLASLLTMSRLSEDNEITAFRASGIKIFTLVYPLLLLTLLISIALLPYNSDLMPEFQHRFKTVFAQIVRKEPTIRLEDHTITSFGNYRMYVGRTERQGKLKDVVIYKFEQNTLPTRIIAREGTCHFDSNSVMYLELSNGSIQQYRTDQPQKFTVTNFTDYSLAIPTDNSANSGPSSVSLREIKSRDLKKEIKKYKEQNIPTTYLEAEYYLRIVIAFSCFAFALAGIPLGIKLERSSMAIGFGVSILVIFFYYLILLTSIAWGERGVLPPAIALWIPNILVGGFGIFNLWQLNRY